MARRERDRARPPRSLLEAAWLGRELRPISAEELRTELARSDVHTRHRVMHVHTAVTAAQRAAAAKAGEIGGSLVTARRHCEALEEEVCEPWHRRRAGGAVRGGGAGGDTGGASSISAAEQQNRMRIAARQRPHLSLGPDSD